MKLNTNEIKFLKFLMIVLFLSTSIAIATETTWRHPGFEVAQYDINFTSIYNLTEVRALEWGWNTSVPAVSGANRATIYYNVTDNKLLISKNGGSYYEAAVEGAVTNSTMDKNLSNYTNTPNFITNSTMDKNISNYSGVVLNESIPLSAANLSANNTFTGTGNTSFAGNVSIGKNLTLTGALKTRQIGGIIYADQYATLQDAINDASQNGIHEVWAFSDYTVPGRLTINNGTVLDMHNFTISLNGGNISSEGFATLTLTNAWLTTSGVPMQFGLRNAKVNGTNGIGNCINIYGKAFILRNILVYDCKNAGIYIELGQEVGIQNQRVEYPNTDIDNIISLYNVYGFIFNMTDAKIGDIVAGRNSKDGVLIDTPVAGGGSEKINKIITYGNGYIGLNITAPYNQISIVESDSNILGNLKISSSSNIISNIKTWNTTNKAVWFTGDSNHINSLEDGDALEVSNTFIQIDGNGNIINDVNIRSFDDGVNITGSNNNIGKLVTYRNTSGHHLRISGQYNEVGVQLDGGGRAGNGTLIDASFNSVSGQLRNFNYGMILGRNATPSANRISNTIVLSNYFFNYIGGGSGNIVDINGYVGSPNTGYSGAIPSNADMFKFAFWGDGVNVYNYNKGYWGTVATAPSPFGAGDTYFNSTSGYPCWRNATSWNRYNDSVVGC